MLINKLHENREHLKFESKHVNPLVFPALQTLVPETLVKLAAVVLFGLLIITHPNDQSN